MIHSRQCWGIVIIFIIVLTKANARNKQQIKEEGEELPPDFMSFVKSLDSMVFQSERKKNSSRVKPVRPTLNRLTQRIPNRRYNNDKLKASQTAAIRDILMLKLVSYYEDKYNVARTKVYTTPQMLEPMEGRRRFDGADSIEKTARLHKTRKGGSSNYADNVQDHYTNTLEPSQEVKPDIEEVVVL